MLHYPRFHTRSVRSLQAARALVRVGAVVFACTLIGCPGPDDGGDAGAPDASGPLVEWNPAFDTSAAGSLSGVWGSSPDDVFIVGGDEVQGEIHHWDGSTWTEMELPATPLIVWSYGFGPDDVYAVGLDGSALHYDGATWTPLTTGVTADLWGVWGRAADDIWMVGGDVFDGDPVLLHYDGQTFTQVALDPAENPIGVNALFKVWGIGDKLFAVGQSGLLIEYDGQDWKRVPAGERADADFIALWGTSEDNIVVVGGRGNARVATYDGTAWDTVAPAGIGGLNAVFMEEPGTAYVGGLPGYGGAFDVASREVTGEPLFSLQDIHAMWGDGTGKVYAVGGNFAAPHAGVAFVRTVTE